MNLIDFEPQAGHDAEVWPCSTASQLTRTNVADDLAFGEWRIRVTDILEMLSEGVAQDEILRDFPHLEPDDIKVALMYAAQETRHGSVCGGVS